MVRETLREAQNVCRSDAPAICHPSATPQSSIHPFVVLLPLNHAFVEAGSHHTWAFTQVHQNNAQIWRRGLCRISSLPLANTKMLSRTYISRLPSSATALQPSQHLLNTTHVRCIQKSWLSLPSCHLVERLYIRIRTLYARADTPGVYITV